MQINWFLRDGLAQCLANLFGQIVTSSLPALSTLLRKFWISAFGKDFRPAAAPIHVNIGLASLKPLGSSNGTSDVDVLIAPGGVDSQGRNGIHNLDDDTKSVATSSIGSGCKAAKPEQNL